MLANGSYPQMMSQKLNGGITWGTFVLKQRSL